MPLDLSAIRAALNAHQARCLPADRGHAAVSLILTPAEAGPELLFIRRAPHDRDPWSGDIGFPGGRLQHAEETPRQAAERETLEELGLALADTHYLGRLDDLYGATLPILVSCFVYLKNPRPELVPNHEIAEVFWFPLEQLLDASRHHTATLAYRGQTIEHPAVDLLGPGQTVLWGITYRLIRQFFAILGHEFGSPRVRIDARPPSR